MIYFKKQNVIQRENVVDKKQTKIVCNSKLRNNGEKSVTNFV